MGGGKVHCELNQISFQKLIGAKFGSENQEIELGPQRKKNNKDSGKQDQRAPNSSTPPCLLGAALFLIGMIQSGYL